MRDSWCLSSGRVHPAPLSLAPGHPSRHPPLLQGEAPGNHRLAVAREGEHVGASQFLQTSGQQATVAVPALALLLVKVRNAVCRFCLNSQVLPEFAGLRPLLGPSRIVPAASFKMKSLASKGNFSGSDARKFPQSEAAQRFGVQTAPRTTVLWNDAWLVLLFLPAHLNRVETQSHQFTPLAARGEGFTAPAARLCLSWLPPCSPRCLLPALVIYLQG